MNCTQARRALSEAIDDRTDPPPAVAAHLSECNECEEWRERAHTLARRMIQPVHDVPRPPDLAAPAGFWRLRAARFALAWIGALLVVFNLPDLFARGVDIELIHLTRHQSAFSMALGVSFLFIAWRPDRAYGMVPVAIVFAIAISGAIIDLVNGVSTLERESIHIAEVVGLVIVTVLGFSAGPGRTRRRRRLADGPDEASP